jgi:peptidoglycan/xylan/chitin deacetylase (PgdA/CDA1 family)
LARATEQQQFSEIVNNQKKLESWTGRPVRCFAYPNGHRDRDYNETAVRILAEAGFECAFTTDQGFSKPDMNRLELPRYMMLPGTSVGVLAYRLLRGLQA